MTILLIDDDEDDRDIFKEAISVVQPQVHCMAARDGEEGLALLEELTILPDYIFLDVNMPVMDGKEFLKRVKVNPILKDIPVVVYSTSKHQSELGEYFSLGASNYITKPSEFNLLLTYLKSVLK
jgi:CheY-like chemotaxis protein